MSLSPFLNNLPQMELDGWTFSRNFLSNCFFEFVRVAWFKRLYLSRTKKASKYQKKIYMCSVQWLLWKIQKGSKEAPMSESCVSNSAAVCPVALQNITSPRTSEIPLYDCLWRVLLNLISQVITALVRLHKDDCQSIMGEVMQLLW